MIEYTEVRSKPPEDMKIAECILVISRRVGLNHPYRAPFGLSELNSIHAYLTGDWYFPKDDYRTPRSPDPFEVRQAIARVTEASYDPGPNFNRTFTLSAYRKIAEAVMSQTDERPKP